MKDSAAFIVGAYEHPTRLATDLSVAQLHADVGLGALADAGIGIDQVDAYFCGGDAPGRGPFSVLEYMGLHVRYIDSTETGGSSYPIHVAHAADAIAAGRCDVALVTMAGRPRSRGVSVGVGQREYDLESPEVAFEAPFNPTAASLYGLCAMRHMYDFGTTSEQLAWVKVAASVHAQHNPNALLRSVVTVDDVLASPMIADPLHRLDCCVVTDGGGAVVVARREIAEALGRPLIGVIGSGQAVKHNAGGRVDLTYSGGVESGKAAFAAAGVDQADIKYASLYDSFTITVVVQIEDLGFCEKGQGGRFVADGNLIVGVGKLPFNTDGGGLCNNHPANRGGMTKIIEAVRQLRGQAHPAVQVPNCDLALVHATGGSLATTHASATLILERAQ